MARILVVDDNTQIRKAVAKFIEKRGDVALSASNGIEALDAIGKYGPDLVLSDLKMPEMDGIELLEKIQSSENGIPVIMLTGHGTVDSAVKAMKLGAADFLPKPVQFSELEVRINRVLGNSRIEKENLRLKRELQSERGIASIVGESTPILELKNKLKLFAADGMISVLLVGETGTGKELAANFLHNAGPRAARPFVAVNCSALPLNLAESELFGHEKGAFTDARSGKTGLFEQANQGTLFLDEIDSLDLALQAKVLRAVEEQKIRKLGGEVEIDVDVRLVSATSLDLETEISEGRFRSDLYYRIAVAKVVLPPLRERREDIPLLVDHFASRFSAKRDKQLTFEPDAIGYLQNRDWSGNVRELRNLIEVAGVMSESGNLREADFQTHASLEKVSIPLPTDLKEATRLIVEEFEKEFLKRSLEERRWNVSQTASDIGLSRASLHSKIKYYSLSE